MQGVLHRGGKVDKKRASLRKRPTKNLLKALARPEGLRAGLSKDEGELVKHVMGANNFVAGTLSILGQCPSVDAGRVWADVWTTAGQDGLF